jgi:hypothetical protein
MLAQYLDLTEQFNENHYCEFETSNYDYALVQFISPTSDIYFYATIDSGAIQSVSDGSIVSSQNYYSILGTDLSTGSDIIQSAANTIIRFPVVGRYIKLDGTGGVTANKILVMLAKIS